MTMNDRIRDLKLVEAHLNFCQRQAGQIDPSLIYLLSNVIADMEQAAWVAKNKAEKSHEARRSA